MSFSPLTVVRLLSNVPLTSDNEHQLYFQNITEQKNYFLSKSAHLLDKSTFQKEGNAIRVDRQFDLLQNVDYVMYQNANYGTKWFYGFVTSKEYVNPNTTYVYFELDVWQTYHFDITVKSSFVEREHTKLFNTNGTPVINTVPEGLEIGDEYNTVKEYVYNPEQKNYYLIASTTSLYKALSGATIPENPPLPRPRVVQGLLTGLEYYIFSDEDAEEYDEGGGSTDTEIGTIGIPAFLEAHRAYIREELTANGDKAADLDRDTNLFIAMIMVESGGADIVDIAQSTEYAGFNEGVVTTQRESIHWGVELFMINMKKCFVLDLDDWTAIQAYNFGTGYVSYISKHGLRHTTDLAEDYSRDVVAPSLGNTTGQKVSYVNAVSKADGRLYRYLNGGNFHYVGLVKQYLETTVNTLAMPVPTSATISSLFGMRIHPITGENKMHNGLDFVDVTGTVIKSAGMGTVVYAQMNDFGLGNYVCIEHSPGFFTGYAHLNRIDVALGQSVVVGQRIGVMGSTGDSTGTHLHFNVSDALFGNYQDPTPLLGIGG